MTENQKMSTLLTEAYDRLKAADLPAAVQSLEHALIENYESEEVLFSLACAQWWSERSARAQSMQDSYERAEYALSQWKAFQLFQRRYSGGFEPARYAFKLFAFGSALSWYESVLKAEGVAPEADASLKIGRCHKGLGDYQKAALELEGAARARKDDPEILAELADAYALVNESRSSKALFREAFFVNPQRVELGFLESAMIERLIDLVASKGYSGPELLEWIPVYGCLSGVFNVKRDLRAPELGKLRQSIYELENDVREDGERRKLLSPRLINRYFWLMDQYSNMKEDRAMIDEILLKVRLLDPSIYKQYVS